MTIMETILDITPESPFDFQQTATSHGWIGLVPNYWHKETGQFERIQRLADGNIIRLLINGYKADRNSAIRINVNHSKPLLEDQQNEIKIIVAHMFRLDEDFSSMYKMAEKRQDYFNGMTKGFGRLLRSPTVFEDILKTICTTNIQWSGTKRMVQEVVAAFGKPYDDDPEKKSFPAAQDITKYSFAEFLSKTNLGYRADYIYLLAKRVTSGDLDLKSFLDPRLSTADLRKKLLNIKGIGNYAAATMLMLLGHYDDIPVDSVFREFVYKKYFNGKTVSEKKAANIYKGWGKWKSLAYWYDMSR